MTICCLKHFTKNAVLLSLFFLFSFLLDLCKFTHQFLSCFFFGDAICFIIFIVIIRVICLSSLLPRVLGIVVIIIVISAAGCLAAYVLEAQRCLESCDHKDQVYETSTKTKTQLRSLAQVDLQLDVLQNFTLFNSNVNFAKRIKGRAKQPE